MRGIKTQIEVLRIKKACELGDRTFSHIIKKIKEGVSEKELAHEIVRFIRLNNAHLSFRPIVSFGKNSFEIHHKPTDLRLRKNHGFLMIDMGIKLNGYCSDMTRTVFFGKATKKQKKLYFAVLKAQKRSIDFVKVNCKAFDIDRVAREYIAKQKFPDIPHSVGHGIGKRVHEGFRISQKSKTIIKNGMVFTIEPGIYIKDFGGVRIEDTFYLNSGKLYQLTKSPKNLVALD